ncbi:MAG TPA: hypothetical protein VF447_17670, partial [Terriglobales bacterium]
IAVFIVYVLGFVVFYLAAFELAAVALAVLIRRTQIYEPWKSTEWRRLASRFLGNELSPPVEEPPRAPAESVLAAGAKNLMESLKENHSARMAQLEFQQRWQKWYDILKVRFPVGPSSQQTSANTYFSVLNSVGWAGLIAAYVSSGRLGLPVWAGSILTIVVSHVSFTLNFSQQQHPDASGDHLAAEILKAIEADDPGIESHQM